MVNKLEYFSQDLVSIIDRVINNPEIAKLVHYDLKNPFQQPQVSNPYDLMLTRIYPYPFELNFVQEDCSQIRIYYSGGNIDDVVVEEMEVIFDILVAKNLWLIKGSDGVSSSIRPYEIMKYIVNDFIQNDITLLNFTSFRHLSVNDKYDAIQLSADLTEFSQKER